MTKKHAVVISMKAAALAVRGMDEEDKQFHVEIGRNPYTSYYEEYLNQLQSGDSQCLRSWLGWMVEEGSREAIEIMKLWIRAELAA